MAEADTAVSTQLDPQKLDAFMGRMLDDVGAMMSAPLVHIGDRLGLYRALRDFGPCGSHDLARRTGTHERYVREWLAAQAASGYVTYDGATKRYSLSPEQAAVFADEDSPVFLAGAYDIGAAVFRDSPKIESAFKSGRGVGWHEHDECLFCGTERFFRTAYRHHLVGDWIPALEGIREKLERGARVADVGCGHGASTIVMAQAFPRSLFRGFDYHGGSIEAARRAAERAGVADRATFETTGGKEVPDERFDLVCLFDCLHDMGDPVGIAGHLRDSMVHDGTLMVVEPIAGDTLEDNLNPVGRIYYSASTMICTPASLSQEVGLGLGAQAGEARLHGVLGEAGFSRVRTAARTPFNMVLEARV